MKQQHGRAVLCKKVWLKLEYKTVVENEEIKKCCGGSHVIKICYQTRKMIYNYTWTNESIGTVELAEVVL